MSGLSRPISKTSTTTNLEINCLDVVACNLADSHPIGFIPLSWCYLWRWGINCVEIEGSIAPGQGLNGIRNCTESR